MYQDLRSGRCSVGYILVEENKYCLAGMASTGRIKKGEEGGKISAAQADTNLLF